MGLETGCCRHQGLRPDGLADRHGVGAGTIRPGIHSLNHARSHAVSLDGVTEAYLGEQHPGDVKHRAVDGSEERSRAECVWWPVEDPHSLADQDEDREPDRGDEDHFGSTRQASRCLSTPRGCGVRDNASARVRGFASIRDTFHGTYSGDTIMASETKALAVRLKVREHRERLRAQGLRAIQIWVPDVRAAAFREQAHQQSQAVGASAQAHDDQAVIDALSDLGDE